MACTSRTLLPAAVLLSLLAAAPVPGQAQNETSGAQAELPEAPVELDAKARPQRISALAEGIAAALEHAQESFRAGGRTAAVRAVDEAHRVAKVALHAASAESYQTFEKLEHALRRTRRSIQNGEPDRALDHLQDALELARSVEAGDDRRPSDFGAFAGATLISAEGKRLGEIERIEEGSAQLVAGNWQDTWGFLDFGGEGTSIEAGRLVFGSSNPFGLVLVAIADPEVGTVEDLLE